MSVFCCCELFECKREKDRDTLKSHVSAQYRFKEANTKAHRHTISFVVGKCNKQATNIFFLYFSIWLLVQSIARSVDRSDGSIASGRSVWQQGECGWDSDWLSEWERERERARKPASNIYNSIYAPLIRVKRQICLICVLEKTRETVPRIHSANTMTAALKAST